MAELVAMVCVEGRSPVVTANTQIVVYVVGPCSKTSGTGGSRM
jgi:hypothetical protein